MKITIVPPVGDPYAMTQATTTSTTHTRDGYKSRYFTCRA